MEIVKIKRKQGWTTAESALSYFGPESIVTLSQDLQYWMVYLSRDTAVDSPDKEWNASCQRELLRVTTRMTIDKQFLTKTAFFNELHRIRLQQGDTGNWHDKAINKLTGNQYEQAGIATTSENESKLTLAETQMEHGQYRNLFAGSIGNTA